MVKEKNEKDLAIATVFETGVVPEKYKGKPSESLVETVIQEIEAMVVERVKIARENMLEVYWETGEILRKAEKDSKVSITGLVKRLAMDNRLTGRQMGERNLWFSLKFYDEYPRFESIYETDHGDNISLTKVKKMLTTPKPKKDRTLKQIAESLVRRLGPSEARKLAAEIEKAADKVEQ